MVFCRAPIAARRQQQTGHHVERRANASAIRFHRTWAITLLLCGTALLLRHGSARAQTTALYTGPDGLPSVVTAPLLTDTDTDHPVRMSLGLGYGYTRELPGEQGHHHRAALDGALAYQLHPAWLVGLQLQGRYDIHQLDGTPNDRGGLLRSRLWVRAQHRLDEHWLVGLQGGVLLPAATAASAALQGISPSLEAVAGLDLGQSNVSSRVGLRWNRNSLAIDERSELSTSDRLGLGISSAPEVLLGAAGLVPLHPIALLAELTWDVPVGPNALSPLQAPLWLRAGARWPVSPELCLGLIAGYNFSQQPTLSSDGPLQRVDPSYAVSLHLSYALRVASEKQTPARAQRSTPPRADVQVHVVDLDDQPVAGAFVRSSTSECLTAEDGSCLLSGLDAQATSVTVSANHYQPARPRLKRKQTQLHVALQAKLLTLKGRVLDPDDKPVIGARVSAMRGDSQLDTRTDGAGEFAFSGQRPGELVLRVEANDMANSEQKIVLNASQGPVTLHIHPPENVGQLRGTVRSLRGKPLKARIKVLPGSHQLTTRAHGKFALTLDPGTYSVTVSATGYTTQRHDAHIQANGVNVLLIELQPLRHP